MAKKPIILFLAILAFSLVVSGCLPLRQAQGDKNQNTNVIPVETGIQNGEQNTGASTTTEEIDNSNWKTYRNEEYGFEFKYPSYFKIIDNSEKSTSGNLFDLCPLEDDTDCRYRISGYSLRIVGSWVSDIKNLNYQYTNDPESVIKVSFIEIAQRRGKLVEVEGSVKGRIYWIQIINDNKLYTFKVDEYKEDNYDEQELIVEKIISTFLFK